VEVGLQLIVHQWEALGLLAEEPVANRLVVPLAQGMARTKKAVVLLVVEMTMACRLVLAQELERANRRVVPVAMGLPKAKAVMAQELPRAKTLVVSMAQGSASTLAWEPPVQTQKKL
jgi:hypothetical protein